MRVIIKPLGMVVIAVVLTGVIGGLALKKNVPVVVGAAPLGKGSVATAPGGNYIAAERWKFYTEKSATGRLDTIEEKVNGKVLTGFRVTVQTLGPQGWNIGLSNSLQTQFRAGEKLQLHFWARSSNKAQIALMIQRNVPGFPHCFNETIDLTPDWKEYRYDVTTFDMAKWEAMIAMHAGYTLGTVDIAGAELTQK